MDTETTETEVVADTNGGEGETSADTVSIPKSDYEKLNQTLGSLKRELKDLKKPKEETKETPQTKPDGNGLIQKTFLRAAGISDAEEVELALSTAKKWGVEIDQLIDDADFQAKLEKHRTNKANALASSNIKGSNASAVQAKNTPEYWIQKGEPPRPADVPDRKTRQAIISKMMSDSSTGGKKFYND